ncbi:1-acyl-sn-glycerol-3-phosphate acyltransferase delta-like [Littorina saxatilis]|uniref:Phospholipid/glycerol acyltransferase domain-containing protein n=1 Tax=Littorina saxatilis TaxID=31220 RepID=A0AAN9GFV4_9CAEN
MSVARMLKSWIIPQLLLGYIFVTSGLIVCGLMALSCVIWPFDRQLYRKINVRLAYAHWCQLTFLAQWWSGTEVLIYMDDEDMKKVGKEHVMVMMNHKYDIDWLMAWILAERFSMLGGTKIFGKEMLRYVPLIGWAWYFTESIFLKRQWEHDRKIIKHDVARIVNYPEGYWITVLLFPEGTRFTEEKLKASQEVCRAKGYPLTKHTLLPRTKGFVLSMHGMKGKVPALYNATVGFPTNGPEPTLMSIIMGVPLLAHFHCVRIPLEDVPTDTDVETEEWLRKEFKQKDDLYDEFLKTGKFPGEGKIVPWRFHDLLLWFFWAVLTCVPLFYYIASIFIAGTLQTQLIFLACVAIGSVGVRMMIRVTETESGSKYGTTNKNKEQQYEAAQPQASADATTAKSK